jgi:hypothetical protein
LLADDVAVSRGGGSVLAEGEVCSRREKPSLAERETYRRREKNDLADAEMRWWTPSFLGPRVGIYLRPIGGEQLSTSARLDGYWRASWRPITVARSTDPMERRTYAAPTPRSSDSREHRVRGSTEFDQLIHRLPQLGSQS